MPKSVEASPIKSPRTPAGTGIIDPTHPVAPVILRTRIVHLNPRAAARLRNKLF